MQCLVHMPAVPPTPPPPNRERRRGGTVAEHVHGIGHFDFVQVEIASGQRGCIHIIHNYGMLPSSRGPDQNTFQWFQVVSALYKHWYKHLPLK